VDSALGTSSSSLWFVCCRMDDYLYHRPLKIRTDGGRSRVRKLGSIGIFSIFTITLSNVVRLLQNLLRSVADNVNKCGKFCYFKISTFSCVHILWLNCTLVFLVFEVFLVFRSCNEP